MDCKTVNFSKRWTARVQTAGVGQSSVELGLGVTPFPSPTALQPPVMVQCRDTIVHYTTLHCTTVHYTTLKCTTLQSNYVH